jgi:hypothetical protein
MFLSIIMSVGCVATTVSYLFLIGETYMLKTHEIEHMTCVGQGSQPRPAPIPEEGRWIQAKEISDYIRFIIGVGWCAPQQGTCKLSLNIKEGINQEALVETIGCTGMTSFCMPWPRKFLQVRQFSRLLTLS